MLLLLAVQLVLAYFAFWRGWRVSLAFVLLLPWTVVGAELYAPWWIEYVPSAVTAAGLTLALSFFSLTGLSWIAVASPQNR